MTERPVTIAEIVELSGVDRLVDSMMMSDLEHSRPAFDPARFDARGLKVIYPGHAVSRAEIAGEMKESGLRPGCAAQLLAWHRAHPEDDRTIIALGTVLPEPGPVMNDHLVDYPALVTRRCWWKPWVKQRWLVRMGRDHLDPLDPINGNDPAFRSTDHLLTSVS